MESLYYLPFYFIMLTFLYPDLTSYVSSYILNPTESVRDGQNLTSQSETFELGFFSPSNSKSRYLGIWYKTIPVQTVVWVANRDSPLNDSSGVFMISPLGNLVILNSTNHTIWSTNLSKTVANPIVEFLESGNIVLRDKDSEEHLWESFDYPTDTLLPGMKLGWNLKTRFNRYLTSWKSSDDPSRGNFIFEIDLTADPEPILRYGSVKYHRGGPWNGIRYSGSPDLKKNTIFTFEVVSSDSEVYYIFRLVNQSVISRFQVRQTGSSDGQVERLTWVDQNQRWVLHVPIPRDRCDAYDLCGVGSTCDTNDVPVCQCLKGFKPRSPSDWNALDWSGGCEHRVPLDCKKGDGFMKFTGVKLPDTTLSWMNTSMNLEECKQKCLKNCSCVAYTNSDIRFGGSGCVIWFRDLIDIRQLDGAGQDLNIRMAASEIEAEGHSRGRKRVIIIVVIIATVVAMLLLGSCIGVYVMKKRRRYLRMKNIKPKGDESQKDNLELPAFDLDTIATATNNFSQENKLGEGGFGPVYKGQLADGHEIAVKRLSMKSIQGIDQFKNEVILISKLQHRNLVRLLGYCIQDEEKMLIYEYLLNKSLNYFIFDRTRSTLLDWQKRFQIILGIARGLLYLHHDSRLRIIHRDLKASNILLDSEMEPKISDFGIARIFGGNQIEANTDRVVGTHGYMSPEYAVDGHFSVKSDVFSFGVLVLEILSGKKNRGFYHTDHQLNLLGHAWRLWNEDKALELIDDSIGNKFVEQEVLRCIHTGLLCVQQSTQQRPTMSSVVLMLSSDSIVPPQPQPPGFYIERSPIKSEISCSVDYSLTASNDASITMLEGR